jgi:hypothetical protein
VKRRNAVFAEWKRRGEANPIAFSQFTASLLQKFKDSGALLARKFPADSVDFVSWKHLIFDKANVREKRTYAEAEIANDNDNDHNNHHTDDENHSKRLRTD